MMGESLGRMDRIQHGLELLVAETHARRLDHASGPQSATNWSTAGFPVIPRNLPIYFAAPTKDGQADPDVYLADCWHERESWGVWGRDALHALRFALDRWRGGYVTVRMALRAFQPIGKARPNVDFTANGYFLGSHQLGSVEQVIKLRLPPSCIGDGDVVLQMAHEAPLSPLSFGTANDGRQLGVGLAMLAVG
jgi:hypothetical protein